MSIVRFALLIGLFAIVPCAAQEETTATPKIEKFITTYGAKIHYVEAGSGAPVILIHGLADNVAIWDAVIPALAARFRVIALDQIGFGRSDKPLLNYRVSTLVGASRTPSPFRRGRLCGLGENHGSSRLARASRGQP